MVNNTIQLEPTVCPLCQEHGHDKLLYPATITKQVLTAARFSARRQPDRVYYNTVICQGCGIVRGNPILKPQDLALLYEHSLSIDEEIAKLAAATYEHYIKKFLSLEQSDHILEIGCGRGHVIESLVEDGFVNVKGLEPGKRAVDASAVKAHLINGMFDDYEADPKSLDAILAFHVFDHVLNPNAFLTKAHQLLKPNAPLMMVMHDINAPLAKLLGRRCPMIDIEHPFLYNKDNLKRFLEKHGFRVLEQFDVVNAYPLSYWLTLAPGGQAISRVLAKIVTAKALTRMMIPLALGNQGIVAIKV